MDNKKILITGATGNVGYQVIRFLMEKQSKNQVIAGVRNIEKAKKLFKNYPKLQYVEFDFEDASTFDKSLPEMDTIFLLRPPHISDIEKYFAPLIDKINENNIREIVFLSVQGAEKSKVIPHHKIENLILASNIDYVFLRPSYFMQNLTTTLLKEIQEKRSITLPSRKAKFNWIDIDNIGEAGAVIIEKFSEYKNQGYELTGYENENFHTVTELINSVVTKPIYYKHANPFHFYSIKRREGIPKGMVVVMTILHLLPRFQGEPRISGSFETITGKKPTSLTEFIKREKQKFEPLEI